MCATLPQTVAGAALIFIFTPPFPSPRFPRRLCFCTSIIPPRHLAHNEIKVQFGRVTAYKRRGYPLAVGSSAVVPIIPRPPASSGAARVLNTISSISYIRFFDGLKSPYFQGVSEGAAVRYPPICGVSPPFLRCVTPLSAVRYPPFFRSFLTVLNFWRGRKAPRL